MFNLEFGGVRFLELTAIEADVVRLRDMNVDRWLALLAEVG